MSRVVTGAYAGRAEAEEALAGLAQQVPVIDHAALARGDDLAALDGLGLGADARAALAGQIDGGSVLLLARVADEATADRAIEVLRGLAERAAAARQGAEATVAPAGEELRVGDRKAVRGAARVRLGIAGETAREEASLRDEGATADAGAARRRLTDEDLAAGGLLSERVVEIGETREVPVVEKQAFVREELIVKKTVGERVEHVEETLRHTEVEVEELPARGQDPGRRAFGFDGSGRTL